ncbi:unnamed protein product [Parnassius apollo]|uniref:(apollo) hypothetical protein n=1 Tax=Parnassius apollo TaxID=110799 RepID=A0A8S3XSS8_PARAO|nr:unnamed protein product [Parnassius apollo]
MPAIQSNISGILIEKDQNQRNSQSISGCSDPIMVEPFCMPTNKNHLGEISKRSGIDLAPSTSATLDLVTGISTAPDLAASTSDLEKLLKLQDREVLHI